MECKKCKAELEENTRFCPKCGEKAEKEDLGDSLTRTCDAVAETWFLLGRYHGTCLAKKDKKGLEDLDNKIKSLNERFHTLYKKMITGSNEFLEKKNDN
jgi:hypothetical protein